MHESWEPRAKNEWMKKKYEPGRESQIQTDLNENSMKCDMRRVHATVLHIFHFA